MAELKLSKSDAVYVSSWAAYNSGSLRGDWFKLDDLAEKDTEEIYDEFRKAGLNPEGRDEELASLDYDDFSKVGYYELFGEGNPIHSVRLYEKLEELDNDEFGAFVGLREVHGASEALDALNNDGLEYWRVFDETTFGYYLEELVDIYQEADPEQREDFFSRYVDYEEIKRVLEMDVSYDDDDEPDMIVDEDYVNEFVILADPDTLRQYFDMEKFKRELLMGDWFEFELSLYDEEADTVVDETFYLTEV